MKYLLTYILLLCVVAYGADDKSSVIKVKKKNAREAVVDFTFSEGTLTLDMKNLGKYICVGNLEFKSSDPIIDYNVIGGHGNLFLKTNENDDNNKEDEERGVKVSNFSYSNKNAWNIQLDNQIPMALNLTLAASKNTLNLGGSKITYLSVEAGASKNFINFKTPCTEVLQDFKIETGASKVVCSGILNSNCKNISLENGLGSTILDFSGKLTGDAHIKISNGVGKVLIFIPDSVSARFNVSSSFLATFKIDNYTKRNGDYYSPGFDPGKPVLYFEIENAIGKVEVHWSSLKEAHH